jgi:phage N-6-adenine-methyltransferase
MNYEIQKLMFSSQTGHWKTPKDLFTQLDQEFHFTLDVCADKNESPSWHNIHEYFGEDGLHRSWNGFTCWMNPPYGREIIRWLAKAYVETKVHQHCTVVALLPARTDTRWFWGICTKGEIRFLKGRLHFSNKGPAPFPSMIVVFKP